MGRPQDHYSAQEIELLRELWMSGTNLKLIAEALNRSEDSVARRANRMGLPSLIHVRHLLGNAIVADWRKRRHFIVPSAVER